MADDMDVLSVGDAATPADRRDPMAAYWPVKPNQCPIRAGAYHLAPQQACSAVNVAVADNGLGRRCAGHPEAEDKADICDIAGVYAMTGRCDDVRRHQEAGTEGTHRLISEPFGRTEILRRAEILG